MKFRTSAFIGVIASVFLVSTASGADTLENVKYKGTLVCGVLNGFEPYGFQDKETRQAAGYEVDMCHALADHLGVAFEPKVVTTQGRIPELLQGRIDVMAGLISYTAARDEQVDYSGIYMTGTNRFMVDGESGIKTPEDLKDKKLGVSKGSALETFLRNEYPEANVIGFDDKPTSYLALKTGKVDAILTQTDSLMALKNQDKDGGEKMVVLDPIIYATRISFIVPPNEQAMLDEINVFLARAEGDGTAQKIWDKWFGPGTLYDMKRDFKLGEPANL